MMKKVLLSNGYAMPIIGLGTYGMNKTETKAIILKALQLGYRQLETAPIYLNELEIGEAIKSSGIDRDDIFITSKIPPHIKSYESTLKIADRIMSNLGIDYLDALLINNPVPWGKEGQDYSKENVDVWRALEKLYDEERVGAIGVSNFAINDLERLLPFVRVKPHINQLGIFIGHTLDDIRAYCLKHNIIIQAHSPLARGRIFKLKEIHSVAEKLKLSAAQIALQYVIEKNTYPIVKATSEQHLKENLEALDLNLPKHWQKNLDEIVTDVRDYSPPKAKSIL